MNYLGYQQLTPERERLLSTLTPSGEMPQGGISQQGYNRLNSLWDFINRKSALQNMTEANTENMLFKAGLLEGPPKVANEETRNALIDQLAIDAPMMSGAITPLAKSMGDAYNMSRRGLDGIPVDRVSNNIGEPERRWFNDQVQNYQGPGYINKQKSNADVKREISRRFTENGATTFRDIQQYYGKRPSSGIDFLFLPKGNGEIAIFQKHKTGEKSMGVIRLPRGNIDEFKSRYSDMRNRGASHEEAVVAATMFP